MQHLRKLSQGRIQWKPKCAKGGHFCARPLSHAGIAKTGQRKYPPLLPIRLFPLLLLNNIASGGLSATAELLVKERNTWYW